MWSSIPDEYQKAQREARRFQAENPQSAALPVLSDILPENVTEIPLGMLEIPLSKIKGTYTAGRSPAFAGNFMPLLAVSSEFGQKWMGLCQAHLSEGIRDPIKAYEYLGYYYVMEGHKRVSVLRYFGAYSLHAEVIRLLPPHNPEDNANAVFYEMIGENHRAVITHLWFSKAGTYTKLMKKAAAFFTLANQNEDGFEKTFFDFRQTYRTLEYADWPLTTGDAFALYVDVYGFPYDQNREAVTSVRLRALAPLLRRQAGLPPSEVKFTPAAASSLVVCFAFEGMPGTSESCRAHNAARLTLQRAFPDITVKARFGLPPGNEAIVDFEEIAAARPHLLFAPSPTHGRASLRAMLASKDTVALHQSEAPLFDLLPNFLGNGCPAAFLAGIVAGALTETDVVGFALPGYHEAYSFAHGARLVNPRAHTLVPRTALSNGVQEKGDLVRKLTLEGADIAILPCSPEISGQPKGFLGAYAWLCKLDTRLGCPSVYWGILGYRWDLFYQRMVQSFLAGDSVWGQAGQSPLTFSMGMPLVDFFPIAIRMPAYTLRLLALMRQCLDRDESLSVCPDDQKPFFITVT